MESGINCKENRDKVVTKYGLLMGLRLMPSPCQKRLAMVLHVLQSKVNYTSEIKGIEMAEMFIKI